MEIDRISLDPNIVPGAASFPQLKVMRYFHQLDPLSPSFLKVKEHIVKVLRANRQPQHVEMRLHVEMTLQTLMELISENKSITKLDLHDRFTYRNADELNHFADEHQPIEELILSNTEFDEDDAIILTRQLNSLKIFQFKRKNHGQDECGRFLSKFDPKWQHRIVSEDNAFIVFELFN